MRKLYINFLFISVTLCLLKINSLAQTQAPAPAASSSEGTKKFSYGLNLGYFDMTSMHYSQGFSTGIYGKYNVTDKFSIAIEPAFIQRNFNRFDLGQIYSSTSPFLIDVVSSQLKINSVQIPLVLKYYVIDIQAMHPFILLGGIMNFNFNSSTISSRLHALESTNNIETSAPANERIKSNDFALQAGLGTELKISSLVLDIRLSYVRGLSSLNNVNNYPAFKYNSVNVNVAIGF